MNLNIKHNEGDRLFLMILSKSLRELLKIIGASDKKAIEYNNVISNLMLANLYNIGVKWNGKQLFLQDREKAAEIYIKICEYDPFGVCFWELGRFYEYQLIDAAKTLSLSECLIVARNYYEKSAEKGYTKAYNSLGKLTYYGYDGEEKNIFKALEYYKIAADSGDIYAIMNLGLINMEQYYNNSNKKSYLEEAEKYFIKAALYNNSEGLFQLGIIYEIKTADDIKYLNKAKEYYIRAILTATVENQYSAAAYYKLGNLINNNAILKNDNEIIMALGHRQHQDLVIECFNRSYKLFQTLDLNCEKLKGMYRDCYIELKNMLNF